jgi:LacI family transcriptional regulator
MKEIAALAGVSRGTVDRVLNHRGVVNAETERKVLEIAALLDYQPNKAGMALAAQKKKLKIGVLLFGAESPFFDEVMNGLRGKSEELSIYGCTLTERRIPFDPAIQLAAIDELLSEEIHGLILSPCNAKNIQEKIDELWASGIPCITVNTDIPSSKRIAYVGGDDQKCGRTAAGLLKLITGGHATIGIVTGSHNILSHEARIHAFTDFIASSGSDMTIAEVIENNDDDYKSYEAVSALLHTHPDINALCFTAGGVYGGCKALLANGFLPGISDDMHVVTFDAVPSTIEMLNNGVISATICQQPEEQGARSLALLVDYLLTGELPASPLFHMELSIKIKENL